MAGTSRVIPAAGWASPPPFDHENPKSVHNKFNINTIDAVMLAKLAPQMSTVRAQSVIDKRELKGPFHSRADLRAITGFSERLVDELMERCYFGDPNEPSPREHSESGRDDLLQASEEEEGEEGETENPPRTRRGRQ